MSRQQDKDVQSTYRASAPIQPEVNGSALVPPTGEGTAPGRPPLILTVGPAGARSVEVIARLAGHLVVRGLETPGDTRPAIGDPVVRVVDCRAIDEATRRRLVHVAYEGAGLVLTIGPEPVDGPWFDALGRVATLHDWRDEPAVRLDEVQLALLHGLGSGLPARQAASRAHVSLRTAYRRLADARAACQVESNAEVVAIYHRAARIWSRSD